MWIRARGPLTGTRLGLAALALVACGCGGDGRADSGGVTAATLTSGATHGTGGATTDGATASGSGAGTSGTGSAAGTSSGVPDAGTVPDLLGDQGCTKVDFLFVLDSSVSMGAEQTALIASFPSFIATIQASLPVGSDVHIMVTDTDAESRCTPTTCAAMPPDAQVQNLCIDDGDAGHACTATFTPCDATLGAGVVHPAGEGSSNQLCTLATADRYLTQAEPDLTASFACVAQLGLAGAGAERPMDALVAAVSAPLQDPGGCNAGFLRDDAILVVTFISDDSNYEDAGTPQDWYDALVAAKQGDPQAIVVLGLIPDPPTCTAKAGAGDHWQEFIGLFGPRGIMGLVCETDYGPFFQSAVEIIEVACNDFVPPG